MTDLNNLETAVLRMILDGDHPVLKSLQQQFESCHVTNRWSSGVGFFTSLHSEIESVFVLFVENGLLKTLESYYYDEPWPDQVTNFILCYHFSNFLSDNDGKRNWKALNKELDQALARKIYKTNCHMWQHSYVLQQSAGYLA